MKTELSQFVSTNKIRMSLNNLRNTFPVCKRTVSRLPILTPLNLSTFGMSSENDYGQTLNVEHDSSEREFYIRLGEEKAYLQYSQIRPNLVDLEHTVVPEQHRGHGVAKVLAKTVFDHFVKEDTNMKLTCTYLQKFYNDNPLPHYTDKVVDH